MDSERFPHAVPLVLIHTVFCSCCGILLRVMMPSLFPALTDPNKKIDIDARFIVQGVVPIAVVFAASLVLTNLAYTKLSVAFLQMIKETNLVWTFLLSLIAGMEIFKWSSLQLVFLALVAMTMTVHGELNFALGGFIIQLTAILCESLRIVLQAVLLQGKKLDPLSYVMLVSPICATILVFVFVAIGCLPAGYVGEGMTIPSSDKLYHWAPWLIADSVVAFCLNVSSAMLIQHAGPMSFLMCQLLKDIAAVGIGVMVVKEVVTGMQYAGFTLQILVVCLWSLSKMCPEMFKLGLMQAIWNLFSVAFAGSDQASSGSCSRTFMVDPKKT